MKVRNPLASLAVTMLSALSLTILVAIPVLFIPYFELQLFYIALAIFFVGMFAGRSSLLGSLGFAGSMVGGSAAILLVQFLFWPTGWELLLALGLGALCALGGMATGKLGLRRVERMVESMPRLRRCPRCGARVGLTARKCWSCKGYLS